MQSAVFTAVAVERRDDEPLIMTTKAYGRKFVRSPNHYKSSKKATSAAFVLLLCVPLVSLYIGYWISQYLVPPSPVFPNRDVVVDMARLNYTWYNTQNLTIDLTAGLGNQMFQYASLYGIAKATGLRPTITKENRLVDIFTELKARVVPRVEKVENYKSFIETKPNAFDGKAFSLNFMKNIHLEGFFQSWRYFDHVRSDVRKQFKFRYEVQTKADAVLRQALKDYKEKVSLKRQRQEQQVTFVGVHVRRGDMLEDYNTKKGYVVADDRFLDKALHFYEQSHKNVIFVVCTDDRDWARAHAANAGSPASLVVFSPFFDRHPALDLCLMASCNHSIVTVGTYGWWGGWLAGGDVVYFKDFPKPNSEVGRHFKHLDYFPAQWIPI